MIHADRIRRLNDAEERADGTYGLRVGTHKVKFERFDQPVDVTITKIGVAAAAAPMEGDE